MVMCAAYGCQYRSDRGKGKRISLFTIPKTRIKPEKKVLAARWLFNIGTGLTVNNYTFIRSQKVCHGHFEECCLEAELQTTLEFSKLHYTFDMNFLQDFPGFLILYPQHQGHFGWMILNTAGKGCFQRTSLQYFKIPTLEFQTYQGENSLN